MSIQSLDQSAGAEDALASLKKQALPHEISEITHPLGGVFSKKVVTSVERRQHFRSDKEEVLDGYSFKPDVLYTFDTYQHGLDLLTFELDIGITLGLTGYLNDQPLLFMAKLAPGALISTPEGPRAAADHEQYLWKLEFHHNSKKTLWS
jgi:hypothetical protein